MFGYAAKQGPVRKAATVIVVGMAPTRSVPVMVDLARDASSRIWDSDDRVCCAQSRTRSPSRVSPRKRRPRWTIITPSSFSRLRIAEESAGCDTWQASAALAKCFSRARVTRYSSWRMNMLTVSKGPRASPGPLRPLEELPPVGVLVVRRIVCGIGLEIAALALAGNPAPHFGCEPQRLLSFRVRPRGVAAGKIDPVGEAQGVEPAGRHRNFLPCVRLHRLIPRSRVLVQRRLVLGADAGLPAGPQLFRP